MKKFRINPQKRELKKEYNKVLNEWYEHHENAQKCIVDICRSDSKDIDMAQELCRVLKQEVHDERVANEELDSIKAKYNSTRWIVFE